MTDPTVTATATVTLPAGMTQEEADRLVAEADARQAELEAQQNSEGIS